MSISKKRLNIDDSIKYGFSVIEKNGSHLPQCVICHIVLSNDAMRVGRLEYHLITNHPSLKDKPINFFYAKINSAKRMKLDSTGHFAIENDKLMEASYEIVLLIAKDKKSHTIGQSLVKPRLFTACKTVLNEESYAKVAKISLLNDTIKCRIDEMAHDLKNQIIEKLNKSPFFSLQCDEITDISQDSQLMFYCKFIDDKKFKEEILFSQTLKTTTKAVDVFSVLSDFLISNSLSR